MTGWQPELKLHKSQTCRKCKSLHRELSDIQHKMKRLTGGLSTTGRHTPMSRLKAKQVEAQRKLQYHLDAEFDKMPIWDQHAAVKLNPSLATPSYRIRTEK